MKRIAIINCLKANTVCTGAACLKAFYDKSKSFSGYSGQDVCLKAFMRCNGCEKDPDDDPGMQEKLDRLECMGVEVVHAGVCTRKKDGSECPTITKILECCEQRGMHVVRGTH